MTGDRKASTEQGEGVVKTHQGAEQTYRLRRQRHSVQSAAIEASGNGRCNGMCGREKDRS